MGALTSVLAQDSNGGGIAAILFFIIYLGLIVVVIAGAWKMFEKAGQPGWGVLIPIYNIVLVLQIVGKPIWWIILYLIPVVNIIIGIMVSAELSKRFGRGIGTTLGLIFLPFIFVPILGFGSAQYTPPLGE